MNVDFKSSFNQDIKKIRDKKLLGAIEEAILNIENSQTISSIANITKIVGYKKHYRIDVGSHRIGLFYDNSTMWVVRCLDRKDIYKVFP